MLPKPATMILPISWAYLVACDLNGGATDISKAPGYPGGTGTGGDFTPIGFIRTPRVASLLLT